MSVVSSEVIRSVTPDGIDTLLDLWREELARVMDVLTDQDELLPDVMRAEITIKVGFTHNRRNESLMSDVKVSSKLPQRAAVKGALHWQDGAIVSGEEDTGQLSMLGGER